MPFKIKRPSIPEDASGQRKRLRQRALMNTHPTIDPSAFEALLAVVSKREVCKDSVLDGTLLDKLALEHFRNFEAIQGKPLELPGELSWASACTGSAGDVPVSLSVQHALANLAKHTQIRHLFACEIAPPKQEWIQGVFRALLPRQNKPCLFKNIERLGDERAECHTHGGNCIVPAADIFVCCTSCKDMSKIPVRRAKESSQAKQGLVLQSRVSPGGSAQTMQGLLDYIELKQPKIIFFENVDAIDEQSDPDVDLTNLDVAMSQFHSRGYEVQRIMTSTKQFGVPQDRRRLYLVLVMAGDNPLLDFSKRSIDITFRTLRDLIRICLRLPCCASDLLLEDDHPAVMSELARRLSRPSKSRPYNVEAALQAFEASGIKWGSLAPTEEMIQSEWYATLSTEQRDSLLYSRAVNPQPVLYRDLNWSCTKVRRSLIEDSKIGEIQRPRHIAATQLPKTYNFISHQGTEGRTARLQLGREALLLHGFPTARCEGLVSKSTDSLMHDLSGNMASCPVLLALVAATLAAASWRPAAATTDGGTPEFHEVPPDDDVYDAMAVFRFCSSPGGCGPTPTPPATEPAPPRDAVPSLRSRLLNTSVDA